MGFMGTPRWPPVARTGRTIRAVARLAKVSGFGTVGAMGAHQARTRPTPNADPALLARNEWLVRPEGGLVDAVRTRIERAETLRREAAEQAGRKTPKKRRSDAVLAVEMILSASAEFFRPERPWEAKTYDEERMTAWRDASLAWLKGRYGANLVSAVLHLDEATPHIHAVFVPLTEDHRLSAKDLIGRREHLRAFQDSVSAAMAPLGIQRGMEGSIAVHTDVDEYYARVNRPRDPAPVEVAVGRPPLTGRDRWAAEEGERIKAQVEPALQAAAAQADVAELAHEQVRRLPVIVAGIRADAAAAIRDAEARAEARVEAAERTVEDARREAAKARRAADVALEASRAAVDALKAERKVQAARVRQMPLETVLEAAGWGQDVGDPRYWHGPGSCVRLDGPGSCWDEERGKGAKNAIDLAKLLTGRSFEDTVAWLGEMVGREEAQAAARAAADDLAEDLPAPFELPAPAPDAWPAVRAQLVGTRRLPERLVDSLKQAGLLIARPRGFLLALHDPDGAVAGAESYEGGRLARLVRRSCRDRGWFRLTRGSEGQPRDVFLVESGLDALSLHELIRSDPKRQQVFAAASGIRSRVPWLRELLARGARLFVAYGADAAGEGMAAAILAQYPTISTRWVPKGADWNEDLVAKHLVAARKAEEARTAKETDKPEQDKGWEPPAGDGIRGNGP